MKITLLAAVLVCAAPASAAPRTFTSAETTVTLLELFTSEGCSSCPPAEAWMSQLTSSPLLWQSVVPVVFHVDYWDGLGWPDRLAAREFTERQRRYSAAWRSSSVYTPGFVAAGREWKGWFRREPVPHVAGEKAGRLSVTLREGGGAEVIFTPAAAAPQTLHAWVALLGGGLTTEVLRGENRGRTLRHDFVVLRLQSAPLMRTEGHWTATLPASARPRETPTAVAAWVAAGEGQPPIQATGGWLR